MPIGPNETIESIVNDDEQLRKIQLEIDNSLGEVYMGGRIIIGLSQSVPERLKSQIINNYKAVGWRYVAFSDDYNITLDKVNYNE